LTRYAVTCRAHCEGQSRREATKTACQETRTWTRPIREGARLAAKRAPSGLTAREEEVWAGNRAEIVRCASDGGRAGGGSSHKKLGGSQNYTAACDYRDEPKKRSMKPGRGRDRRFSQVGLGETVGEGKSSLISTRQRGGDQMEKKQPGICGEGKREVT